MSSTENRLAIDFVDRYRSFKGIDFDGQANQIRELFEDRSDELGLAWLDQLENECF